MACGLLKCDRRRWRWLKWCLWSVAMHDDADGDACDQQQHRRARDADAGQELRVDSGRRRWCWRRLASRSIVEQNQTIHHIERYCLFFESEEETLTKIFQDPTRCRTRKSLNLTNNNNNNNIIRMMRTFLLSQFRGYLLCRWRKDPLHNSPTIGLGVRATCRDTATHSHLCPIDCSNKYISFIKHNKDHEQFYLHVVTPQLFFWHNEMASTQPWLVTEQLLNAPVNFEILRKRIRETNTNTTNLDTYNWYAIQSQCNSTTFSLSAHTICN